MFSTWYATGTKPPEVSIAINRTKITAPSAKAWWSSSLFSPAFGPEQVSLLDKKEHRSGPHPETSIRKLPWGVAVPSIAIVLPRDLMQPMGQIARFHLTQMKGLSCIPVSMS